MPSTGIWTVMNKHVQHWWKKEEILSLVNGLDTVMLKMNLQLSDNSLDPSYIETQM